MIFNMFDGGGVDQDVIDDAFDAIAAKGIPIPSNAEPTDLPELIGLITAGNSSVVTVTDTLDSNGGTIRTYQAVSLNGDTVSPAVLKQGFTAHDATGTAITGTATNIDTYDFKGQNCELVNRVYQVSYSPSNTGFASWTPSTTATSIQASITLSPTVAIDLENYDYYIKWTFDANVVYPENTTLVAAPVRIIEHLYQGIFKGSNTIAQLNNSEMTTNRCYTMYTAGMTDYYTTKQAHTIAYSASYGFYISAVAATFSNATSNTPNMTIKTPAINTRCNSTYMSTNSAGYIDQNNSELKLVGDLYRVSKGGAMSQIWTGMTYLYNNPLTITTGA